jgi:SAM-dependent methyltransferase
LTFLTFLAEFYYRHLRFHQLILLISYILISTYEHSKWFKSDEAFNQLYSEDVQALAGRHWTPLDVAFSAARFLVAGQECSILDIGSGVGKFCLAAGWKFPTARFYGIEQRKGLVEEAEKAKEELQLENVAFFRGNFTQLDFRHFEHFYFYNSFYENISAADRIDDFTSYSNELYYYYTRFLYRRLNEMPAGTRLAGFHSSGDEIPPSYQEVGSDFEDLLRFWVRV